MCDPTTLAVATFAISAGSQVANHIGQNKQAKATKLAARRADSITQRDLSQRQLEEMRATGQQVLATKAQGTAARSATVASAAKAGVGGMSVDLLLGDLERQEFNAVETLEANEVVTLDQLQRHKLASYTNAQNQVNSVPTASVLQTGLGVAGAGIDLGTRLKSRK